MEKILYPHAYRLLWMLHVEGPATAVQLAGWNQSYRRVIGPLVSLKKRGLVSHDGAGLWSITEAGSARVRL